MLREVFLERPAFAKQLATLEKQVLAGKLPASLAARQLVEKVLGG
jgi:hypothetical protein